MTIDTAKELQMNIAKEGLALLVLHPTADVQLHRECISHIGTAWDIPVGDTQEVISLLDRELDAIHAAGEDGTVVHVLPEEELQSRINKNVRYEIRRNNKEEVEFRHFTSKELQENIRVQEEFAHMYELMYEEKGMKAVFNRPQLAAYLKADAFALTGIYKDGKPVVFHSYIVGENEVRLLHSVSAFRDENTDANFVARANKRLHWDDMLLWKAQGKEKYDWGGVSSLENPNGIDAFKFKFGGETLTYYNVYEGISLIGKLAIGVLKKRKGKA